MYVALMTVVLCMQYPNEPLDGDAHCVRATG